MHPAVANGAYDVAFSLFGTNVTGIAMAGPTIRKPRARTSGFIAP